MRALFPSTLKPCTPPGLLKPSISQLRYSPNKASSHHASAKQDMQDKVETRELSGSDVLWALEKATANKNKKIKKMGTRKKDMLSFNSDSTKKSKDDDGCVLDYDSDDVKPLCVKEEWGIRLNELESQFKELADDGV